MQVRIRTSILVCAVTMLVTSQGIRAQIPVGPEFQVNGSTVGTQRMYGLGADAAGNFVVMWSGAGFQDVFARRYDVNGVALGPEFQVNTYTTGYQYNGSMAVSSSGNFVVVWGDSGRDGSNSGVFGQRFDSNGMTVGTDFQVNSYTTGYQSIGGAQEVAITPAGHFVVTWTTTGQDGSSFGIGGRAFASNGLPLGAEFQANQYTTARQISSAVGTDANANFVLAWQSEFQDGSDFGIFARRYAVGGTPLGGEFQVNTWTTGAQERPSIAVSPAGDFLIVWVSAGADGSGLGIRARRYDSSGAALTPEFTVNSYTTGDQGPFVHVAREGGSGNYIVSWTALQPSDGSFQGIRARLLDSNGAALGPEFPVNTYTPSDQRYSIATSTGPGTFVVAWRDFAGHDGDAYGIFAQRFGPQVPNLVLGKKLLVKDPTGSEEKRTTLVLGKENPGSFNSITGDPTVTGATLRVIANGSTDSDQTYALDASGWRALGSVLGYVYTGPTGGDGDPVRKVILKRSAGGTAIIKALLKGNVGTQSLDVVPPNSGTGGGIILTINSGDMFCVGLGDAAGGTVKADDAQLWKIVNATSGACPAP